MALQSSSSSRVALTTTIALVGVIIGWSYWPVFAEMANKWSIDPQYSHSYLVPLFSLVLLWKNNFFRALIPTWSFWGIAALTIGIVMRIVGAMYYFDWIEAVSLIPMLTGTVLLMAGHQGYSKSWKAIAFLFFMIPLPYRIETGLSQPLQRMATIGSTYVLQTIGRPAFAEGNIIVINDARIGVVDACNGLGMFLLFFAMATGVALVVQRPLWEKILLVASAAPIAVGVNIVRIVVTSILHETVNSPRIDALAHDFAGWLMMPLALVALGLELKILSKVFVEVETPQGTETPLPRQKTNDRRKKAKSVSVAVH